MLYYNCTTMLVPKLSMCTHPTMSPPSADSAQIGGHVWICVLCKSGSLEIKEECTKCGVAVCVKCYAKYEDTRFALFLAENNKTRHLRTLKSYSENPNNSEFEPFKVKWSLTQRLWAAQAKAKRASKRAAIALKEARSAQESVSKIRKELKKI